MSGMVVHATHSLVIIPHVRVAECSKCGSCICHDSKKLTRSCTKADEAQP
jgi:hypothetical protein